MFLYTNYVATDDREYRPSRRGRGSLPPGVTSPVVRAEAEADGERAEFVRNQYYGLEWRRGGDDGDEPGEGAALGAGLLVADADVRCELRLSRAGAFHYYFVYDTA